MLFSTCLRTCASSVVVTSLRMAINSLFYHLLYYSLIGNNDRFESIMWMREERLQKNKKYTRREEKRKNREEEIAEKERAV